VKHVTPAHFPKPRGYSHGIIAEGRVLFVSGQIGWDKDALKQGDQVLVTGGRAKNGSFNLRAAYVQLRDGRKLLTSPPPEN